MTDPRPDTFDAGQLAEAFGVSTTTIVKWTRNGSLRGRVDAEGRVSVPRAEARRFAAAHGMGHVRLPGGPGR